MHLHVFEPLSITREEKTLKVNMVAAVDMNSIEYDTSKKGLETVLKNWQIEAMRTVWGNPGGMKSYTVWKKVNEALDGGTISRASIINFLEDMRAMGVLSGVEESGKGGYHWIYSPAMDESGFKKFIVEKMVSGLLSNYPKETREVISQL